MAFNVSRAAFVAFFKDYKDNRVAGGDASWADEISPYDVTPARGGSIAQIDGANDYDSGFEDCSHDSDSGSEDAEEQGVHSDSEA